MRTFLFLLLNLSLLIFSDLAHARMVPLKTLKPIHSENTLNIESVDKAIIGALYKLEWYQDKKDHGNPRIITAVHDTTVHTITIRINYNSDSISLSYIDSYNMHYRKRGKKQLIHHSYNTLLKKLRKQIKSNLSKGEAYSLPLQILNPPPMKAFSTYQSFSLSKTTLAPKYANHPGHLKVLERLDTRIKEKLLPVLTHWKNAEARDISKKELIIEPQIVAIRYIGRVLRRFSGKFSGRSWIYTKISFIDKETGVVIAEPELYRISKPSTRAQKDHLFITNMASDIVKYAESNYLAATGGGWMPPQKIKEPKTTN